MNINNKDNTIFMIFDLIHSKIKKFSVITYSFDIFTGETKY